MYQEPSDQATFACLSLRTFDRGLRLIDTSRVESEARRKQHMFARAATDIEQSVAPLVRHGRERGLRMAYVPRWSRRVHRIEIVLGTRPQTARQARTLLDRCSVGVVRFVASHHRHHQHHRSVSDLHIARCRAPSSSADRHFWRGIALFEYACVVWPRAEGLRALSFGDAGPMRRRLTELALAGTKIATAGLLQQDYVDHGEAVEAVGERQALLGDSDEVAAIMEITRVEVRPMKAVSWEFAQAEGEGFRSIEHWRTGHTSYYAKHGINVDDNTVFVCVWFRITESRATS